MGSREEAAFLLGIEQFNRGEFFAAHETWEAIWLAASGADRDFLQGIIQLAAAFHHWRGGNRPGALSLLRRGLGKLAAFPRSYRGICVARLREQAGRWAETLGEGAARPPGRLPEIELEPPPHADT
ncbi:MAG TPA: DUF309 domain-containing protein [Patescibacteria group bacterium]|nr:DUF309 domain-containing protein [Patescibacteria group bacterium]